MVLGLAGAVLLALSLWIVARLLLWVPHSKNVRTMVVLGSGMLPCSRHVREVSAPPLPSTWKRQSHFTCPPHRESTETSSSELYWSAFGMRMIRMYKPLQHVSNSSYT
jgi:hypothetical protein